MRSHTGKKRERRILYVNITFTYDPRFSVFVHVFRVREALSDKIEHEASLSGARRS